MHFGKQLKFLAFPPWKHEYLDYGMLKKTLHAMVEAGKAQGCTRVVTREWIVEKDGLQASPAGQSLAGSSGASGTDAAGSDRSRDKKDRRRKDRRKSESALPPEQDPVPDSGRRLSLKDYTAVRKSRVVALEAKRAERRNASSHELRHLMHPETPDHDNDHDDAASTTSTTTGTTEPAERASVELVSVIDMQPPQQLKSPAMTPALGAESDSEREDSTREIVVLTDELEELFFVDFWKERDRVDAFFREHAAACKARLTELVNEAKDRRAQEIPVAPLKQMFVDLLVDCEELNDYARLNLVGFTKILKKFTHRTDFTQRTRVMAQVQRSDFVRGVPEMEVLCDRIKREYLAVFGRSGGAGKGGEDEGQLRQELTQSVSAARSWKLNTIIFQMDEHMSRATLHLKEKPIDFVPLVIALVVYLVFTFAPMFPAASAPAQRALAILLAAVVMWITECWPLFMTSTLCVVLTLVSYVFVGAEGQTLAPVDAVPLIYRALFPSSLPLVIAGFCISQAWSKYGVDVMIAMKVLQSSWFSRPSTFVIAVELICFFMSAWVSNIAAAVLTLTVISPVIRDLPEGCRYIQTLLMAIALSGNVGGMTTQLASPQNALTVSLGDSSIGFIEFIAVSLPVCPVLLILGHLLTIAIFPPDIEKLPNLGSEAKATAIANASSSGYASVTLDEARTAFRHEHDITQHSEKKLKLYQGLTIALTIVSVALWVASNFMTVFGQDIGMISFVPIALFCGTGLVDKADFERLPWALVALIAGGNVLGKAIESSQLLDLVANLVGAIPQNLILIMFVTSLITMVISCFVSHTIASIILLPLAAKIGAGIGHSRLMVMVINTVCTASIAVPVSSFPNLTATSVEDSRGKPYLTTVDFLKIGIPVTFISLVCICTITFGMCLAFGY